MRCHPTLEGRPFLRLLKPSPHGRARSLARHHDDRKGSGSHLPREDTPRCWLVRPRGTRAAATPHTRHCTMIMRWLLPLLFEDLGCLCPHSRHFPRRLARHTHTHTHTHTLIRQRRPNLSRGLKTRAQALMTTVSAPAHGRLSTLMSSAALSAWTRRRTCAA